MSVVQSLLSQLRQGSLGQWYATKSPTDRLVIKIVTGLTLASVVYTGLWKPVKPQHYQRRESKPIEA